tara:strand:+ start:341 stop:811 length:471 start_codon:yes stop_codon:yes gene_type:complete
MPIEERDGKFYTPAANGGMKEVSEGFANQSFKKGSEWKGNRLGRPKKKTLSEELYDLLHTEKKDGVTHLEALAKVILQQAERGRFPFIKEVLERMEGKVADKTQLSGLDGKPLFEVMDMSDEKRRDSFYRLLSGSIDSTNDGSERSGSLRGDGLKN